MQINLIARSNGVGLDRDVELVADILSAQGHVITRSHARSLPFFRRLLPGKPFHDLNIFMERVFPAWIPQAKINVLIPNQERFPSRLLRHLRKLDHVFCKTRHAQEIFRQHHPSVHFTGFTSKDCYINEIQPSYQKFFHLAGRSTLKGTETLLGIWANHPEWPQLTLVQHRHNAPKSAPSNIQLISDYLQGEELQKLQNSHGIHLCPSLSEGWGHHIVEAMSTKSVVLTTNAPPMNELINSSRGLLVPFHESHPRHLGTSYCVDPIQLEAVIQDLVDNNFDSLKQMGSRARSWFLENQRTFHSQICSKFDDSNQLPD
jgi:glycosyltransferase involved in cell wall biosynthesis